MVMVATINSCHRLLVHQSRNHRVTSCSTSSRCSTPKPLTRRWRMSVNASRARRARSPILHCRRVQRRGPRERAPVFGAIYLDSRGRRRMAPGLISRCRRRGVLRARATHRARGCRRWVVAVSHCCRPPHCIGDSEMCACTCAPCHALRRESADRDRWVTTANEVHTMANEVRRYQVALRRIADQASLDVLGEQLLRRIAVEALEGP